MRVNIPACGALVAEEPGQAGTYNHVIVTGVGDYLCHLDESLFCQDVMVDWRVWFVVAIDARR